MTYTFCREGLMTEPICAFVVSSIGGFSQGEVDHVSYRHIILSFEQM